MVVCFATVEGRRSFVIGLIVRDAWSVVATIDVVDGTFLIEAILDVGSE